MKLSRLCLLASAVFAAVSAPFTSLAAEPQPAPLKQEIPDALKPWVGWATWDDKDRDCPVPYSDARRRICLWPSRLTLDLTSTGGKFDFTVTSFAESWIALPGGAASWPAGVSDNGNAVPVVGNGKSPAVYLPAGVHRLQGTYQWSELPQNITVPPEIGIVTVTVNGKPLESPAWDGAGTLWLQRTATSTETERPFVSSKVYAVLNDGIPLTLTVQLELIVAGKSREEELQTILPEGWKLSKVESPIPVMVDDAGRPKAQVRAGTWTIRLEAFRFDNPKQIRFAEGAKRVTEEMLIAFKADPSFRSAELSGAQSVDATQTTFPAEWRHFPVFRWETAQPLTLEERMRGMGEEKLPGLKIDRQLWLDEDGRALTFRDSITGARQQIWRLDAAPGHVLGSVRASGEGQLITSNPANGATGVEIRHRSLNLEATGRLQRSGSIPATGWSTDAEALHVNLNLPPGWRLFALFGADWVEGDWLTAWTLLDLFLLLIFTVAVFRMFGVAAAVLAFVAFGLSFHEAGAPRYLWLLLLIPIATLRVLPGQGGRKWVTAAKWTVCLAMVLVFAPFAARQVQLALHPQLESVSDVYSRSTTADFSAEGSGALPPPAPAAAAPEVLASETQRKLEKIIIPQLELREATVREAVETLNQQSIAQDQSTGASGRRGVQIILAVEQIPAGPVIPGLEGQPQPPSPNDTRITVSLQNIPLGEALRYVTGLANLKYGVDANGSVKIVPLGTPMESVATKEYKVPPGFFSVPNSSGISQRMEAKGLLEAQGVAFPPGSLAEYRTESGKLIVRNTPENLDLIDSIIAATTTTAPDVSWSSRAAGLSYDPGARIQTGPAVPDWSWRSVSFGFNGPVSASQEVRPILIPAIIERLLCVARVFLMLLLLGVLLSVRGVSRIIPGLRASTKLAAVALACFSVGHANAQLPNQQMLDQLRQRLLEKSDAFPNAADIPSAVLKVAGQRITVEAEIHVITRTAVPLPGKLNAWSPVEVTVDGKPETTLRRDDGSLWVVLEPGIHKVTLQAALLNQSEWQWSFVLKPRRVTVDAPDWNVSGVRPDGTPEQQVFLAQKQKIAPGAATYDQQRLSSLVRVERSIQLGVRWEVQTRVRRLTPRGTAISLQIPLLPGENVISSDANVRDGKIEVRLAAREAEATWSGTLPITNALKLSSGAEDPWLEAWSLAVSPIWSVALSGLPPVFEATSDDLSPTWKPWPGESVDLAISRPQAVAGATLTISSAKHTVALGKRQRTSTLEVAARCSVGQDLLLKLESDAEITALRLDGKPLPIRKDGAGLVIPLHPGEQTLNLDWKLSRALTLHASADKIGLPSETANVRTTIQVPDDRWVLWTHGPQRGPAVQFWGILVCSLIAATILARVPGSPLRLIEWMLLLIGLTQVELLAGLAVVAWLFLLVWRRSERFQQVSRWRFNLLQLFLVALTAAAIGILLWAVGEGLLGRPEMFIAGNGSSVESLQWFAPRTGVELPQPGLISVSIWWYRLLMLLWALWLASAVLRWLRFGWDSLGTGGFWKRAERPPALPTAPTAPPTTS